MDSLWIDNHSRSALQPSMEEERHGGEAKADERVSQWLAPYLSEGVESPESDDPSYAQKDRERCHPASNEAPAGDRKLTLCHGRNGPPMP